MESIYSHDGQTEWVSVCGLLESRNHTSGRRQSLVSLETKYGHDERAWIGLGLWGYLVIALQYRRRAALKP